MVDFKKLWSIYKKLDVEFESIFFESNYFYFERDIVTQTSIIEHFGYQILDQVTVTLGIGYPIGI